MVKELNAFLLGHSIDEETGEVTFAKDDIAPMIGIGAIGTSKKKNINKYIGKFYRKAQFKEPNDENETQQENVSFKHSTLEGNMFVPEDGVWKNQKEFETLEEAKAWLNEKVGISEETSDTTDQVSDDQETGATTDQVSDDQEQGA